MKKKAKKRSLTLIKKDLWKVTRLLVFATYGSDCFTCDAKNLQGSNRHGGHVPWASSELSITCRYDIRFIRAQCYDCNVNKNGRGAFAQTKMLAQGIDIASMWHDNLDTKGVPRSAEWLYARIADYQERLALITNQVVV